ncbi:hypothetical protein B0J14DRAFT_587730 [Halenospora varia]|nr:hypothetical protein B0J14DRAFT_587730 [Halenospora varia]
MSLPKLPYELLLSITELLDPLRDINALVRTNKRLYRYLNDYLYRLDVQATGGSVLMWAAKRGSKRSAWLSLAEGADIEALHTVMIPRQLSCLGFNSVMTCLTSLQIALCYGSGSVARLLIEHGAITTKSLGNCTSLHIASAIRPTRKAKSQADQTFGLGLIAITFRVGGRVRCAKHVNLVTYLRNRQFFARIAAS